MSKFNYDDEGKQKTGGRNLVPPPPHPKTPPPSQPKQENLFNYQQSHKVKHMHPLKAFGKCPVCNESVNIRNHRRFCGECGNRLDWSNNED